MCFLPQLRAGAGSLLPPVRPRALGLGGGAFLLMFLALSAGRAAPVALSRQTITLPANAAQPLFADIEGDGRCDLLVLDPVQKELLNYHHRPGGFSNSPDQAIPLPPQTAWLALCDVDPHPGLELLFSTATGLVYSRQNAGLFESERHTLIKARQAFADFDFPVLSRIGTNKAGTNVLIPVILAGQSVLYHRNNAYEWTPGPSTAVDKKQTLWRLDHDWWREQWTLGANPARCLEVQQFFPPKPDSNQDQEPDNEAIRKLIDDMKKNPSGGPPKTVRVDVDGDGREDLILWRVGGKLDIKTNLYIFLRGADQKLPDRPTQILHCRGLPIPTGSTFAISPVMDLDGDGVCELVLLELKSAFTSAAGAVEAALSHGLDWSLTIRSFHHGAFSRSPDASVPVTGILPPELLYDWPVFILGDFNGDGRPDLLFRRSDTQWNIFFSTTDGRWFAPQPAMTFDAPAQGYGEIVNLYGDGLSDIVWHDLDSPNLSIFLSPSHHAKGKNP